MGEVDATEDTEMLLDKTEQQVRKVTQKHILARQRCVCGGGWVCAHVVCDRCVCKVSAMASPHTNHTVCVLTLDPGRVFIAQSPDVVCPGKSSSASCPSSSPVSSP